MRLGFGIKLGLLRRTASIMALYMKGGFYPATVLDFENDTYLGTVSSFSDLDFTASSNGTVIDSDGVLKWRAHNTLGRSNDFSSWTGFNAANYTVNYAADPDGGNAACRFNPEFQTDPGAAAKGFSINFPAGSVRAGETWTVAMWVKPVYTRSYYVGRPDGPDVDLPLYLGIKADAMSVNLMVNLDTMQDETFPAQSTTTITDVGGGWYYVECQYVAQITDASNAIVVGFANRTSQMNFDPYPSGLEDAYFYGVHAYRSDLGGMQDNPDRGDAYVENTTISPVYLPRWDYATGTRRLLIEPIAATNLETHSVSLSNYDTNTVNCTVTTGQTDFNGGTDAALIEATTTTKAYCFGVIVGVGENKTFSAWLKAGTVTTARIQIGASAGTLGVYADVDLSAGTIGAATLASGTYTPLASTIEDYGNGWYRASVSATCPAGSYVGYFSFPGASQTEGDNYYFSHPQLEAGSVPTSYIPTTGATAARAAETLALPAAKLPTWYPTVYTGAETITNGDFTTDATGWTASTANVSIASVAGQAQVTNNGAGWAYQAIATEIGQRYELSADFVTKAGGGRLYVGTSIGGVTFGGFLNAGAGQTLRFTATTTTTYISLGDSSGGTGVVNVYDNISVRAVKQRGVSILWNGNATYADTSLQEQVTLYRIATNVILYSAYASISTLDARTGNAHSAQRDATSGLDGLLHTTSHYSPGINVPISVASRHSDAVMQNAANGSASTKDETMTTIADPTGNNLVICPVSGYFGSVVPFSARIARIVLWSEDIGQAGIEEATA